MNKRDELVPYDQLIDNVNHTSKTLLMRRWRLDGMNERNANKEFRKGQRVYSALEGWGTIKDIRVAASKFIGYIMTIEFDDVEFGERHYLTDGRLDIMYKPWLSDKPYDEKPIYKDDVVMMRNETEEIPRGTFGVIQRVDDVTLPPRPYAIKFANGKLDWLSRRDLCHYEEGIKGGIEKPSNYNDIREKVLERFDHHRLLGDIGMDVDTFADWFREDLTHLGEE